MVNAATTPSPERLSTKALAAAGQFRAIALWLNEPLIPQGIYAQVSQDKRPGCIRIVVEFSRIPNQKPLTQYICHLMWQLNSPLIEGIHLIARPIGESKFLWEQRIRVMTPALRERLKREQGQGSPATAIPPAIAVIKRATPSLPGFNLDLLLSEQLKTLRAFMLTGSAVAAFVFGCMVEVVMSSRSEPALPFQSNEQIRTQKPEAPRSNPQEPKLPDFQNTPQAITADRKAIVQPTDGQSSAIAEATSISYRIKLERDRPNVVNAALEPVGVLQHERLANPQDPTITLLFGGDVDLDGIPYDQLEYDGQLLSGLPAYRMADLAMVNLQDPLTPAATSLQEELLERQRPDAITLLKEGGVDVVNLAGKSSLNFGEQGLAETLDTLDRNGIFRLGAGRTEREARRPEVLDVKGQRIAYLSYDRDFELAAYNSVGGVNAVKLRDIIQDIQAIRDEVDWLVVNFRWSEKPPETPAESQTNLARLAIDQGADLVVGQHPSQLQGAEIYKGRPIAYSLGDFVFGQATEAPTAETAVLQVSLREGQMKVDLIPVKVRNGQPQKANGTDAKLILDKIQSASKEFRKPMPPSVVLNAGSGIAPDLPMPSEDGSFTGTNEDLVAPSQPETAPTEADSVSPTEPTNPDAATPITPDADDTLLEAPVEADEEALEIEVEPIPEGLLDDWGPKDSSNTIYEPESALPNRFRLRNPNSDKLTPKSRKDLSNSSKEPLPLPETEPIESEVEVNQLNDAIAPYSEPLVGPLSSLPEVTPDMKMHQDAIAPMPQPGMPESRVFEPLNTLEPAKDKMITVEVKSQEAIALPDTNPEQR